LERREGGFGWVLRRVGGWGLGWRVDGEDVGESWLGGGGGDGGGNEVGEVMLRGIGKYEELRGMRGVEVRDVGRR
jgi:hypothetical protein